MKKLSAISAMIGLAAAAVQASEQDTVNRCAESCMSFARCRSAKFLVAFCGMPAASPLFVSSKWDLFLAEKEVMASLLPELARDGLVLRSWGRAEQVGSSSRSASVRFRFCPEQR